MESQKEDRYLTWKDLEGFDIRNFRLQDRGMEKYIITSRPDLIFNVLRRIYDEYVKGEPYLKNENTIPKDDMLPTTVRLSELQEAIEIEDRRFIEEIEWAENHGAR